MGYKCSELKEVPYLLPKQKNVLLLFVRILIVVEALLILRFFLVISLLLQFLFLFFLLCALEDEGKLYGKDIFTGRGVKSQAGLS